MAPYQRDEGDYYSTYSGKSRPRNRHDRRRSSHYSRDEKSDNQSSGFAKVALGIIFVEIFAACMSSFVRKKEEQREHEHRREKRRQFEKAKARRRREEKKWERQQEEHDRKDSDRWEDVEVHEVRRIGYGLPDHSRARSESRAPRNVRAPDSSDDEAEGETWRSEARSGRDTRSRSRPAVDVT